jgi:membrane-bound metal-dependent hydrolase YbcI (DUF457 family)
MLGFAVGVGCVVHLLGDLITKNGVPILWPIPLDRRMWKMVGIPNSIAVKVGGPGEVIVLRVLFTVVALLAVFGLIYPTVQQLYPSVLQRFDIVL